MLDTNELWEQLNLFEWFKDVVDISIHEMIKDKLGLETEINFDYSEISFFPIYTKCKKTGGKTLKSLNLKCDSVHMDFVEVGVDAIEESGASWEEFINYLVLSDAKFVYYKNVL